MELKNEATKPTGILEDKKNIQVLQPNLKILWSMSYREARNIKRPRQKLVDLKIGNNLLVSLQE